MAKIQSGDLPEGLLDRLKLDALPEGVDVEADNVHLVYDVAKWLGSEQIMTFNLGDIDTQMVTLLDHEANDLRANGRYGLDRQRYYQTVFLKVDGVSVSPISTKIYLLQHGKVNGAIVVDKDLANPSTLMFGPIYCAPSVELVVRTYTNGGMGDTLEVWYNGFSAPAGSPLPILPGVGQ